jgi:hypothetical protein
MAVRKPLNLDDEDLTDAGDLSGRAPDEPTSMFCFLERIRLSEKMRMVIDKSPLTAIASSTSSYEQVWEIDAAIASFLQDTPHSLPLETKGWSALCHPHSDYLKNIITVQRYLLNSLLHGQRCRLHLPYLIRSAAEASYGVSRKVALESARFIIDAEVRLTASSQIASSARVMLGSVLFSYFAAVAVLALNLCLATGEEIQVKRHEFEQAWQVLEQARGKMTMIEEGMQILEVTMRKHGVWPSTETGTCQRPAETQPQNTENFDHGLVSSINSTLQQDYVSFPPDLEGHIRQLDGMDWDVLRWVVDVPFL